MGKFKVPDTGGPRPPKSPKRPRPQKPGDKTPGPDPFKWLKLGQKEVKAAQLRALHGRGLSHKSGRVQCT